MRGVRGWVNRSNSSRQATHVNCKQRHSRYILPISPSHIHIHIYINSHLLPHGPHDAEVHGPWEPCLVEEVGGVQERTARARRNEVEGVARLPLAAQVQGGLGGWGEWG